MNTGTNAEDGPTPNKAEHLNAPPPDRKLLPEPVAAFKKDGDERCIWVDPLAYDPRMRDGAVLLGDVIRDYVKKYNILFDNQSFDEGKLKGGSYTMTPDEKDAWTYKPDKDKKSPLERDKDHLGEYYIVPPNSLVYIKLKQTLRIPFYLIGRHNLKIRYVYRGLLLGTGPQVDPGFEGNLFIPLHNFTTSPIKVYINGPQNSFVSIDFVRTTHFIDASELPVRVRTVADLRIYLKENCKEKVLIEEEKVQGRRELEQYLEGATPRSQLAQFQFDFAKLEKRVSRVLKAFENLRFIEVIAVAGIVIAALSFFGSDVAEVKSETQEVKATFTNMTNFGNRLGSLEVQSTSDTRSTKAAIESLSTNVAQLQLELSQIASQLKSTTSNGIYPATTNRP